MHCIIYLDVIVQVLKDNKYSDLTVNFMGKTFSFLFLFRISWRQK